MNWERNVLNSKTTLIFNSNTQEWEFWSIQVKLVGIEGILYTITGLLERDLLPNSFKLEISLNFNKSWFIWKPETTIILVDTIYRHSTYSWKRN